MFGEDGCFVCDAGAAVLLAMYSTADEAVLVEAKRGGAGAASAWNGLGRVALLE